MLVGSTPHSRPRSGCLRPQRLLPTSQAGGDLGLHRRCLLGLPSIELAAAFLAAVRAGWVVESPALWAGRSARRPPPTPVSWEAQLLLAQGPIRVSWLVPVVKRPQPPAYVLAEVAGDGGRAEGGRRGHTGNSEATAGFLSRCGFLSFSTCVVYF